MDNSITVHRDEQNQATSAHPTLVSAGVYSSLLECIVSHMLLHLCVFVLGGIRKISSKSFGSVPC